MLPAETSSLLATVVVPVHNGETTLGRCLDALANQTIGAEQYEVIVVDDGSSDDSAAVAAGRGVQLFHQAHAGAGAARNRGARQAQADVLLFTDADCEPEADWIARMLSPLADPSVIGVKGIYCTRQQSPVARFAQAEYEEKYDRMARAKQIDFVDTYSAAYRRDVFVAHGGFDPRFVLDEDQELSFRLARAGHRLVFAPDAVVYHLHPATVLSYARRKARLGYWKIQVHGRHPGKAFRDSYTPWTQKFQLALLPLVGLLGLLAVPGWVSWITPGMLAGLGLFSAVPLLIKAAHQGWDVLLIAPALALVRALALDIGLLWGLMHVLNPIGHEPETKK